MSFHKTGSPAAIATEVTGLFWLAEAPKGAAVAEVVNRGQSWLETRRLTPGIPDIEDAARFGRGLAYTHAAGAPHWGAPPPGLRETDARLAELPAPVSTTPRWECWGEFYAEARLVLHRAIDLVAEGRFDAPQPALVGDVARIHGDLWAGNVMWAVTPTGTRGTLIDPSAHGGHAETDLAELALFGASNLDAIIAGYQEVSPLADGWRQRIAVHQFHMILVHAALYAGNYVHQALTLARRLRGDAERNRRDLAS